MHYRKAEEKDLEALVGLTANYCKENNIEYDEKSIRGLMISQIINSSSMLAFDGDTLVGGISYFVFSNPFNYKNNIARKMFYYLEPEYRGLGVGEQLLNEAEADSKTKGATKFYLSSTKKPSEDYTVFETDYVKEL